MLAKTTTPCGRGSVSNSEPRPEGADARLFAALVLALCAAGAFFSFRDAWTERLLARNTREGVRRALEIDPANARAWERWAALDPNEAPAALERAVALNPYLTRARLELALRAEAAGEGPRAEALLAEAFRHDRMFLTRWTLANFYFRAGDEAEFWRWARASAEYAHSGFYWLFDLCHRMSPDSRVVLAKVVPPRASILSEYLQYLLATNRLSDAPEVFARLAAFGRSEDLPLLLSTVDRSLGAGESRQAVALWNRLAAAGLIPHPALDPERGRSLTNAEFRSRPLAHGFDWHPIWNPAAFVSDNRVEFSGGQLDETEVLWQPVPLIAGAAYTLRCRYRTSNFPPNSGLRWQLLDPRSLQPLSVPSPSLSSEVETEQTWHLRAPDTCRLARLSLVYTRQPGTTRIAGAVELRSLSLTPDSTPLAMR